MLKAANPLPSLIQEVTVASTRENPRSCVDPSKSDPEEWDCECMESLNAYCEGDQRPKDECFKEVWCSHKMVCQTWKDVNCLKSYGQLSVSSVHDTGKAEQADVAITANTTHKRRQPPTNSSSEPLQVLEQSLSSKPCAQKAR